jgi:hypothetical protein
MIIQSLKWMTLPSFEEWRRASGWRAMARNSNKQKSKKGRLTTKTRRRKARKKRRMDSYGIGFPTSPLPSSCLSGESSSLLPRDQPPELTEESSIPVVGIIRHTHHA